MIQSLAIKNFKSHDNTQIQFTPGLNVIVPHPDSIPNDIGKTNIIHALRWLIYGEGTIEFCIRDKALPTSVELTLQDEDKPWMIGRRRDGSKMWSLVTGQSEVQVSKNEVPDDVQALLRMPKIDIFGSGSPERLNLRYAPEYDECFLINVSPAKFEKAMNYLFGSQDAEAALKQMTADKLEIDRTVDTWEDDVRKVDQQLEVLEWVEDLQKLMDGVQASQALLARLEALEQTVSSIQTRAKSLSDEQLVWVVRKESLDVAWEAIEGRVKRLQALERFQDRMVKAEAVQVVDEAIDRCRGTIVDLDDQITRLEAMPKDTKCLHCGRPEQCPHCGRELGDG